MSAFPGLALSPRLPSRGLAARAARVSLFRTAAGAAAAVLLSHLAIPDRPPTLCPLRALTGIPCPVCGTTTAAVRLGRGDLVGALAANPFAIVGAIALVLAPVVVAVQSARRASGARPSVRRRSPRRNAVAWIVVAVAAEFWQLVRFGLI